MRRPTLALSIGAVCAIGAALLFGQQTGGVAPIRPHYEVMTVLPREVSPGHYLQVERVQLDQAAAAGWDLVTAAPYIYLNEEHGGATTQTPKPVVTQVYLAYVFRRGNLIR